jgi:hypothetical protein
MVPCFYTYLDDFQNLLMRRGKRVQKVSRREPTPPIMAGASEDVPASE